MRFLHVGVDRALVQLGRVDVHAGARLHHVRHHHADDQRQRGEEQEVGHRLGEDPAHRLEVGHAGDAGDDGQEDHRRDDHLHQLDEGIAEWLEAFGEGRLEMAQQGAKNDRHHYLEIQLAVEGDRRRQGAGRLADVHDTTPRELGGRLSQAPGAGILAARHSPGR